MIIYLARKENRLEFLPGGGHIGCHLWKSVDFKQSDLEK